jgi:hypothetical protein
MLSVLCRVYYAECHYAECHCAECHYAEFHYAECHYAGWCYVECRWAGCRGIQGIVKAHCKCVYFSLSLPLSTPLGEFNIMAFCKRNNCSSESQKNIIILFTINFFDRFLILSPNRVSIFYILASK